MDVVFPDCPYCGLAVDTRNLNYAIRDRRKWWHGPCWAIAQEDRAAQPTREGE